MGLIRRPDRGGLCVIDIGDDYRDETTLAAKAWRIIPKDESAVTTPLRFYRVTEFDDKRHFWVYADDGGSWVFVEKNDDYEIGPRGAQLILVHPPSKRGDNWEYEFPDYADGLIAILPPGMAPVRTSPPAQATIKRDRLMLFFMRAGISQNWGATIVARKVSNKSALVKSAQKINRFYYRDDRRKTVARRSYVQPNDGVAKFTPDRTLQATLWSIFVACIALIVAGEALTQGLSRVLVLIFGAVAAALTAVWLIGTQMLSHRVERGTRWVRLVSEARHWVR